MPPSEAFRARAAERYRANLTAMIALGRSAGVPLLFPLPVANLRVPPTFSVHAPGFTAEREFEAEMRAAAALREAGKHAEELAAVDRALALSPEYGLANYARGEALRALGRDDEARVAYQRAIDGVTYRITSRLEQVFVDVVAGAGAPWVDLRPLFHADLSDAAAHELFIDHVHPTAAGHARIADALREPALALLPSRGARAPSREGETR